jgi:hypothetical protein
MASYMPQDVFTMCAVTAAAQYNSSEGTTIEEFAKRISDEYHRYYIDDGYEEDKKISSERKEEILSAGWNNLQQTKGTTSQSSETMCYRCRGFPLGYVIWQVSIGAKRLVPVTCSPPQQLVAPNRYSAVLQSGR